MQLLALVFASTSVLSAFAGGPATETLRVDVGAATPVTVEVALSRAEGDVPVPIRITAGDVDVDVRICDGGACAGARALHIPAHGVVEDVAIVDDGRPNLRLIAPTVGRPREESCCARSSRIGRAVAFIGDAPVGGADAVETFNNNPIVYVVGVGRLLDERPAHFGNFGAVVMRTGDLDHDAAFFENLRRFAALGGLVSVDAAQGARLALGDPIDGDTLHARNLAVQSGLSAGSFEIAFGKRSVGTFPLAIDAIPGLRGTVFPVDNGLVIVRDGDLAVVDATADLVNARSRFVQATRGWSADGELTNSLLVGLQPSPSAVPMALWFVLTSIAAAVVARVVSRRRAGMAGPVLASLAVVVTLVVGSAAAIAVSVVPSTWRTVSVRVLGPGKAMRTRTVATARSPDFNVDATAFRTAVDDQGNRSFIAGTRRAHRPQLGSDVAEVSLHTDVDESGGYLLQRGYAYTNQFPHPVMLHARSPGKAIRLAPGASITPDLPSFDDDDSIPVHAYRLISVLQQQCQCGVASFVDADGVFTIAQGTFE